MAERPIEQLTLRELFTNAEWVVRELTEHLEQSFHPKLQALQEMVKSYAKAEERDQTPDSTVRTQVAAVLSSDDFSAALFEKLEKHLEAIDERSRQAAKEK